MGIDYSQIRVAINGTDESVITSALVSLSVLVLVLRHCCVIGVARFG